jgi:hypothetical protein
LIQFADTPERDTGLGTGTPGGEAEWLGVSEKGSEAISLRGVTQLEHPACSLQGPTRTVHFKRMHQSDTHERDPKIGPGAVAGTKLSAKGLPREDVVSAKQAFCGET